MSVVQACDASWILVTIGNLICIAWIEWQLYYASDPYLNCFNSTLASLFVWATLYVDFLLSLSSSWDDEPVEVELIPPTPSSDEVEPVGVGEGEADASMTVFVPELIVTVLWPVGGEVTFSDFSNRYVVLSEIRADNSASFDLSVKFCKVSSSLTRSNCTWKGIHNQSQYTSGNK